MIKYIYIYQLLSEVERNARIAMYLKQRVIVAQNDVHEC